MSLNAPEKAAQQRLTLLQLAEALGNISEACRRRGVSRTMYYEYKRRFQTHGLEGLKDLPPIHKTHPQTTPPEVVKRILEISLAHPAWGRNRLSDFLKLEGPYVSALKIQEILNAYEMGTRYHSWIKLEEKNAKKEIELTPEQVFLKELGNPCFNERHVEFSRPGELLNQDTFYVGQLKGVGKVYLHAVVDTYSSYSFGFLHVLKQPKAAQYLLYDQTIPFFKERGIPVFAVLTDNGKEFCEKDTHPYEIYPSLNEIAHLKSQVRHPQTESLGERFNRTVLDEFFRLAFRTKFYQSVVELQEDLCQWLAYYNAERPHQGYIRAFSLISKLCTIAAQNLFYGDGRDIRNHWSVE